MKVKTIKEKIKKFLIAEEHTFTETQEGIAFNYEDTAMEINIMEKVGFELSCVYPFQGDPDDLEIWSNLLCFIREKYKQSLYSMQPLNPIIKYDTSGKLFVALFVHCQELFLRREAVSKAIQTLLKTMRIYETGLKSIIFDDADPVEMFVVCLEAQIAEEGEEEELALNADAAVTDSEEDMPIGGRWFIPPWGLK